MLQKKKKNFFRGSDAECHLKKVMADKFEGLLLQNALATYLKSPEETKYDPFVHEMISYLYARVINLYVCMCVAQGTSHVTAKDTESDKFGQTESVRFMEECIERERRSSCRK